MVNRIGEASPPFQTIAQNIDLSRGHTFAYIPQNVNIKRIRRLEFGGVIEGEWVSPNSMQLSTVPQHLLVGYLRRWLRRKPALQPSSSRLILTEDLLWKPSDPFPSDYLRSRSFIYEETLYLWGCNEDSVSWIRTLVDAVNLSYPPLLVYGFDTPHHLIDSSVVLSVLKDKDRTANNLALIVMGIFDGESFLIWRKRETWRL
jgi:hypothetical protein